MQPGICAVRHPGDVSIGSDQHGAGGGDRERGRTAGELQLELGSWRQPAAPKITDDGRAQAAPTA